jgi:hypothetical protein
MVITFEKREMMILTTEMIGWTGISKIGMIIIWSKERRGDSGAEWLKLMSVDVNLMTLWP